MYPLYLKGIEVNGFKSFADKINLEFGQGITAIVGPNGSGKSNVSDAIRWVLGEQSVKSLRGSKMEDVIFAGTQKRSPMGFAQVSIVFDNKDRIFGTDTDEIKVTRKLHRSGESEYRINNAPCRLKDVHEMFMDTGLGREGYSVIGQGKIDQILSSKAEERRHIFEEASGITKYKYRKHEAEKKLLAADDNLLRIKDLIVALSDQVGPLETQSKKAKQYLELREKLKGLDINIAIRNIDKQREALKEGQEKFNIAFNHLGREKNKLHEIEESINTKTTELSKLNEEVSLIKEKAFAMEKDRGGFENNIELLKNDIKNNNENVDRWNVDIDTFKEKINSCFEQIKELKDSIEGLNTKKEETEKNIKAFEEELKSYDEKISLLADKTEEYKSAIVELLSEISSVKARLSSLDVLLKNFDERRETLKTDMQEKKELKSDIEKRLEKLNSDYEENKKTNQSAHSDMEKLKADYFSVAKKFEDAKNAQNEFIALLNEKQSRINILEELERDYEGYAKSVKTIINQKIRGVEGTVSKLLEVEDKYITAIEIALGNNLQNIVVADEKVAKECISYLKSNKAGRATFLPVDSVHGEIMKNAPEKEKGFVGVASDLISYDSRYDGIFKSLLGRTVIADTMDNASQMAKKSGYKLRIVTLDGQLFNPGGSLTGGSIGKNQSLLTRGKEIDALREEIESMRKKADKKDDEIAEYKSTINKMAEKKESLEEILKKCEHEEVRLSSQIESDTKGLSEISRTIDMLTNEGGDVVNEIADIDKQKEVLGKEIAEKENEIKEIRTLLNAKEQEMEDVMSEREKVSSAHTDILISYGTMDKDAEMTKERIALWEQEIKNHQEEIKNRQADIELTLQNNKSISEKIEEISKLIDGSKSDTAAIYKEAEAKQKEYDDKTESLRFVQQELKSQNDIIYDLQQEVVRLESKNAKIESDTENVINRLWEEYELTYNTALELKKADFNMNEAQKEASSIRNQIKALGNINIDAIEQYKEVKEKFDYLTEQKKDLDETKEKLTEIINEMQKIMIKQFNDTFVIIKEKFNKTFASLFGGGEGRLSLSDPDNILESGIEIEVQPPGKKLQNMMVLSGGERALSAIALLLSVLEVRPTPFCILDEVEAALDENNVYRFADYIKKYSKKTQFIVVTHRRGTMESADIMYGVTMQEKGISKLLKLKFEDLKEQNLNGA